MRKGNGGSAGNQRICSPLGVTLFASGDSTTRATLICGPRSFATTRLRKPGATTRTPCTSEAGTIGGAKIRRQRFGGGLPTLPGEDQGVIDVPNATFPSPHRPCAV
jgi:hypothetical protein